MGKTKRVIKRLTGERKTNKSTKENDYEVQFKAPHDGDDCKHFYGYKKLVKWGWDKACKKVIISHNNDFTTALCPETWVVEKDEDEISRPNCRGDPEWMKNALATKCDDQQAITEVTDAYGNVT